MAKQLWAAQLRNSRSSEEQITVLKNIKNEIVGHPLKKESAVRQGILDLVVRLIYNKSGWSKDTKAHDHTFAPRPLNEEELVRLQGLQVLASIALGGPAFLPPLQASSALSSLLSNLCPSNNPSQIVLASLRGISNLVESASLASNTNSIGTPTIAEGLFSRPNLSSLCRIISQTSPSSTVQSQTTIAASLISRVCKEERHQQAIANCGIIDALATKLASFVVAEGLVIPGADISAQRDGLQDYFPQPAPHTANLAVVLEAIAVVIADSKLRASQLLYSPSILAIFPISQQTDFLPSQNARAAWAAFNAAGLSARQSQLNAVDYLLPVVPHHQFKPNAQSSAFPPLGTSTSGLNLAQNGRSGSSKFAIGLPSWSDALGIEGGLPQEIIADAEEPESPLIAYLIFLLRSRTNMERLMAASVLSVLYRAGLTNKTRETAIGLLVVPLLVSILDEDDITKRATNLTNDEDLRLTRAIKERAPAILAMLITDSEYLQKAAVDAGAVAKLSQMMKVSYDQVTDYNTSHPWSATNPRPWTPHLEKDEETIDENSPHLGDDGHSPLLMHKIKIRECTLKAIAALVPFKDEYRKAIVDQGVMPFIVESMRVYPSRPQAKVADKSEKITKNTVNTEPQLPYGTNPVSVLIAACGAVRALSRSVSVLRTTLVDTEVAGPVFDLLEHQDIEVQIAATAAVCNLLTDVCPMREQIAEAGVVKILCKHAHSDNAKLRLNAVWALKHFVQGVSNDMKRQCLDQLGSGQLVHLISDDIEDEALNSGNRDTSTPSDEPDEDVVMDQFEEQVDLAFNNRPITGISSSRPSSSRSKSIQATEVRLSALRDAETNPARKARKDDLAIQEQGLDFIRNLIGSAGQGGTETTEMIDFLFGEFHQEKFFEMLCSKLRPKSTTPFHRRRYSSSDTKIIPPQPEIIIAVSYILVHMAASVPRHRQLVIAQTELLRLLVPQFNNPNIEVRLALCWLVTNLTWLDDNSDSSNCMARATELRKLGFLQKLEVLESDSELNVRERAKSALWQMKQTYSEARERERM